MGMQGGAEHLQSEINVTPMVDIMLVLLIIFMVVVPLLMEGYDVNIPRASANNTAAQAEESQLVLSIVPSSCNLLQPPAGEGPDEDPVLQPALGHERGERGNGRVGLEIEVEEGLRERVDELGEGRDLLAGDPHAGQACQVEPGGSGRPLFAGVHGADSASAFVAVPVTMNGQVIAVLCGEQSDGHEGSERLLAVFEVIARHAARVLETLTALRLAKLGSHVSQVVAAPPPQ